jgi:putative ATPase
MPEAKIPLANATVLLATSPKSNSAHDAVFAATADVQNGLGTIPPTHLQAPLYKGYKYPHEFPNHYVEQQYLPNDIKDRKYYVPATNRAEQAADQYWREIKGKK